MGHNHGMVKGVKWIEMNKIRGGLKALKMGGIDFGPCIKWNFNWKINGYGILNKSGPLPCRQMTE